MAEILHNGIAYPVTAAWHTVNTIPFPHLAAESRQALRTAQDLLLETSNQRALTDSEEALLAAANNHFDVRTAIDFLGGRPHTDFGFTGVDQVHGMRWSAPCGCQFLHVFDHHLRNQNPDLHLHGTGRVCFEHKSLKGALQARHAQVSADAVK